MTFLEAQRTSCDWRSIIKSSKNGGFKISWEYWITQEFIWLRRNRGTSGKKGIKTLSVLCWWESVNSSISSPVCPWGSGKNIINAGWALSPRAPRMCHVSLHLPKEPPLTAGGHQKSLNIQWKLLHMKLQSRYTWTHVFGHLSSIWKTEGWKIFLGLWRGEGEGRDRGCSFSSLRILEPVLQQGQVSHSFSRAHFYAALYLPRPLPTHREQLRLGNRHM